VRTRLVALWIAAAALPTMVYAQITVPATPPPTSRFGGNIRATPVKGPLPRKADGRPDLSGVWLRQGGALPKGDAMPAALPEILARQKTLRAQDDPQGRCLPIVWPRGNPYPFRMVETPTHIFLIEEAMHGFRQIFMDGRGHPPDVDPTWWGHSIGRWDGDTLIVDTVGYNDQSWLDAAGHLHSDRMHTIERFTRRDLGTMTIEFTVDDPGAYQRPFTITMTASLMAGQELMEYFCQENNQDLPYIDGPAGVAR
jgi:hypothetical protein